jgi:hypothetical protein
MDATAGEIRFDCGDWVTMTHRSSRPVKPTAKVQESAEAAAKQGRNGEDQSVAHGGKRQNWVLCGRGTAAHGGCGKTESPTQTVFRTLLQIPRRIGHCMTTLGHPTSTMYFPQGVLCN